MPPDHDPNEPPNANASPPGPAAPAAFDPSTLPPEAVAYFAAEQRKASDAAAAAARKAEAQKAKPATPTTPSQPPVAADDVHSVLALRDAFDDAAGDLPLKSSQRALMREAAMRERPADMGAFVGRYVERAGWNTAGSPAPQPAVPAGPVVTPQAPAVPSTHRAPPPPASVFTESTPILTIASSGDWDAVNKLVDTIGLDEFVKRLTPELKKTRVPLI